MKSKQIKNILIPIVIAAAFFVVFAVVFSFRLMGYHGDADQYLDLGNKYLAAMEYEEALIAFTNAISVDDKAVDAYLGRAEAYTALDDRQNALSDYEKALELAPDRSDEIKRKMTPEGIDQDNADTGDPAPDLVLARKYGGPSENPDYEYRYYYDEAGRVTREQYTASQAGSTTLREYDENGNEILITGRDKYNIITIYYTEKSYDANNNLILEIDYAPTDTPTSTITKEYDDHGNVVKEIWTGPADDKDKEVLYRYDSNNNCIWEKETDYWNGEATFIKEQEYQYDENNNCTNKFETFTDTLTNDIWHTTYTYEFNEKKLCVYESWENDAPDPAHGETSYEYEYDAAGHVVTKKIIYSDRTELYKYTYDAYGNMLSETYGDDGFCDYYEYRPLSEVLDVQAAQRGPLPAIDTQSGIIPPDHWIERSLTPHYTSVAQPSLIMRVGPGTTYDRIKSNLTIPYGTEISELGYSDGVLNWFVTEYQGQYGWICSNYTELLSGECEKPVIYLYPEKETQVHVELELLHGQLTCTYPQYENGWDVIAQPDGMLTDIHDNRTYSYLYWEGQCDPDFDFSAGFVVRGEDTATFLQQALEKLGLLPKEYNDFIVYWLPRMQDNPYNLISFQTTAYTQKAQLHIEPEPDTLLRVFMAYKPLAEPIDVPPQVLRRIVRKGFTAVEWGGTCVN